MEKRDRLKLFSLLTGAMFAGSGWLSAEVDFVKQVKPILESACLHCHWEKEDEGGFRLDTKEWAMKGGDGGDAIVPGDPEESWLYTSTILDPDDDDIMPPSEEKPLDKSQTEVLRQWIEEGAKWPDGVELEITPRIDFVKHVQPIFEQNCVGCHREGNAEGDFRMDTMEQMLTSGEYAPNLIPFDPDESGVWFLTVLDADDDELMPPTKKGGPLSKDKTDIIKNWIAQGAVWPQGLTLTPRKAPEPESDAEADAAKVGALYTRILSGTGDSKGIQMTKYRQNLPGTAVTWEMVPIPSGKYLMGSPESEEDRKDSEGPQIKVEIEPFWMMSTEVTWDLYDIFTYQDQEKALRSIFKLDSELNELTDVLARPTTPYVEMSFGMGKDGFPAISMTQHAALQFCQFLSAKTGHFYRLPTEAEWEYACRAGSKTKYHFGDDISLLGDYAWYEENSDWKYQKVGKKKPNPWGLHDMHGNVAEWCIDQFDPNFYATFKNKPAIAPVNIPTKLYPRSVRGGSWDHPAKDLRSAARMSSTSDWKIQDPQLPKSIWYHTDAQFLGFRVIRPLQVPSPEEMQKWWSLGRVYP